MFSRLAASIVTNGTLLGFFGSHRNDKTVELCAISHKINESTKFYKIIPRSHILNGFINFAIFTTKRIVLSLQMAKVFYRQFLIGRCNVGTFLLNWLVSKVNTYC